MRKFLQTSIVIGLIGLLPTLALAHNLNTEGSAKTSARGVKINNGLHLGWEKQDNKHEKNDAATTTPANTHPASGRGTVTAVSGNNFTLQLNNHGIISSATVNTNASTTIITKNGTATTTAAITVGSKVKVKGFWDEISNILKAIKVKIF